jgi:drug/metabolite transporter (DMT)-like permease
MAKQSRFISWLLLFSCNLMWSLQFTCIKLVQNQVGPLFTVWLPTALSVIILYPLVRAERRQQPAPTPPTGRKRPNLIFVYLLLGIAGVVPGQLLMTWGTRLSLASNAALLTLTLPVTTAIFAVIFLKEKMTRVRWLSFILALIGVVLCSGVDIHKASFNKEQLFGNLLIFGAILGSSFYNSYGKTALEWHSPMEMLFWTYVVLVLLMTPFVVAFERESFVHLFSFTAITWTGLLLLTVFHTCLSMILFLKALKSIDAIQAALSNYLIAFFGVPIAAFMLHEHIGWAEIAGGLMVLSSTVLVTLIDRPTETEPLLV